MFVTLGFAAAETQVTDGFTLADAGVVVAIIVGVATLLVPAMRWAMRHVIDDGIDRAANDTDRPLGRQLHSVDRAVNQVPPGERPLVARFDDLCASHDELRGEVRDLRGEVHEWRAETLTADQTIAVAAALDDAHGDDPPLTPEQTREIAREIARRRARGDDLPDNPEDHPHD